MPNKDEIFRIWAPPESPWSPWAKPVLFSFMDSAFGVPHVRSIVFDGGWVPAPGSTAIVVDLPGEEGVMWGLKLAGLGYRPVPLYNALPFGTVALGFHKGELGAFGKIVPASSG